MSPPITCRRFVARNIYIKWRGSGHFLNCMTNVRQIVPLFADRFSVVFADVEASDDESGKH